MRSAQLLVNLAMHNRERISPIIGKDIALARQGRTLVSAAEVEIGTPGVTAILGHNGAGKSLLLKVLTGLIKPDRGVVSWNGKAPSREGYQSLGYMKQNAVLLRRSARANLEYPLLTLGMEKTEAAKRADEALERAGLTHIADSSARVLSGGERQRLSLVRMLIVEPEIIILDEPTASLDPQSKAAIERIILHEKAAGKSITLVTHDVSQARRLSDDIIFLNQGVVQKRKTAKTFFSAHKDRVISDFLSA